MSDINIEDIQTQAAIEFDGIIRHLPDGFVPIHGNDAAGKRLPVRWARTDDLDGWLAAVTGLVNDGAVNIYGGGNPRVAIPSNPNSQGGAADIAGIRLVFVDLDVAKDGGYLPDHATANRVAAEVEAAMGLPAAYVNATPGGQHRLYLMAEDITPHTLARIGATFEELLAEAGYEMDKGTTKDIVRSPRYAGALHSKNGSEPTLVTNLTPTTTPVDPATLVLREVATKGDGSLVAAPAGSSISDQFAAAVPMSKVLPAWGFSDAQKADQWRGEWPGATSEVKATTRFPERVNRDRPEPVGRALILSAHMASDLGVANATQPFGAFDWLLGYVTKQGVTDSRRAFAIAAGVAEHWMASDDPTEFVEWLVAEPPLTELQTMARSAQPQWPDVSPYWKDRLAYRGVSPDMATLRGYREFKLDETADRDELVKLGTSVAVLDWLREYGGKANTVLAIPTRDLAGNVTYTFRTSQWGWTGTRAEYAVDTTTVTRESINDTTIPLVLASTGRELPTYPTDSDGNDAPLLTGHTGMAQVIVDSIATAALNEDIKLAVLGVNSWSSLLSKPGEDGHREARLKGDLRKVPLRGRTVYLVGREDWRFEPGLVDLMCELRALGATPLVIDTPAERATARMVAHFGGTYTMADALASGNHALAELMTDAYAYDRAKWEATPVEDDDAALVNRLLQSLRLWPVVAFDPEMKRWLRDDGLRLVATTEAPTRWAWQALERSLAAPTRLGISIKASTPSTGRVEALLRALRGVSEIHRPLSEADSNPRELHCANGVVNLVTGTLRPRMTGENNRLNTGLNYNPAATASRFERFLGEFFIGHTRSTDPTNESAERVDNAAACAEWLQSLLGTAATGEVVEKFPLVVGRGSDGKSVLEHAVMQALGEYAAKAPSSMYTGQAGRFDTMRYRGARLVSSSETPAGATMDTAVMKAMSERGYIAGEVKGGEHVSFEATHLPMLLTNHLPKLKDTGDGVQRRVIVITARLNLSKDERDAGLPNRLRSEAAGILRWLVAGAMRHYAYMAANGGRLLLDQLPPSIEDDTAAYFADNDVVGSFIKQFTDPMPCSTVHEAFAAYQEQEGLMQWSRQAIGNALLERGVTKRKVTGIWTYFWPVKREALTPATPTPTPAPVTGMVALGAA